MFQFLVQAGDRRGSKDHQRVAGNDILQALTGDRDHVGLFFEGVFIGRDFGERLGTVGGAGIIVLRPVRLVGRVLIGFFGGGSVAVKEIVGFVVCLGECRRKTKQRQ